MGSTVVDAVTASTIASSTATGAFTSAVTLPAGVWLISYSLRLEPTSGTTNITLYAITIQDSNNVVMGQSSSCLAAGFIVNVGAGLCANGSGVYTSDGTLTYNVNAFVTYTGGTSFGFLKTGIYACRITRTRIAQNNNS